MRRNPTRFRIRAAAAALLAALDAIAFGAAGLGAAEPIPIEGSILNDDVGSGAVASDAVASDAVASDAVSFRLTGAVDTAVSYAAENTSSIYSDIGPFKDMRSAGLVDGKLSFSRNYRSLGLLDFTFRDEGLLDHTDGSVTESLFFDVNEMYGDINFGDLFFLRLGKQRLSWGAGYIFNPSDPVNPPKEPTDRRSVREGVPAVKAELIAMPVSIMAFAVPSDSSEGNGYGAKLSTSILGESDVALSYYQSRSRSWTSAVNITSAPLYALPGWDTIQVWFEGSVYGEGRYGVGVSGSVPGSFTVGEQDGTQYCALVGASAQLPVLRTILLAEYYRLSEGLTRSELSDIYGALHSSDAEVVGASSAWYGELAGRAGRQGTDYLFVSVTQTTITDSGHPLWDKVGLSAACLLNLVDLSFYADTGFVLTFVKDTELDLTTAWTGGGNRTEFGNSAERGSLTLRLKVFF